MGIEIADEVIHYTDIQVIGSISFKESNNLDPTTLTKNLSAKMSWGTDKSNLSHTVAVHFDKPSGSYSGLSIPFSFTMNGLEDGAIYYFSIIANYGDEPAIIEGPIETFTFSKSPVDLDLPSGNLWAASNVGAEYPSDSGGYYAWGEIETKYQYDWTSYKYCMGSQFTLTKYVPERHYGSDYGYQGFTDNLSKLESIDDAATVTLGSQWCTPTIDDWLELVRNCVWAQNSVVNGVRGVFVRSKSNQTDPKKMIFFPLAGWMSGLNYNQGGYYWASEMYPDSTPYLATDIDVQTREMEHSAWSDRYKGLSIRAVQHKKQ